jgi:hypothetical protein
MFGCRAESDVQEKNIKKSNFTIQTIIVLMDQRSAGKRNIATAERPYYRLCCSSSGVSSGQILEAKLPLKPNVDDISLDAIQKPPPRSSIPSFLSCYKCKILLGIYSA